MAEVTDSRHIVRSVIGTLIAAAILGAVGIWRNDLLSWFGQSISIPLWLLIVLSVCSGVLIVSIVLAKTSTHSQPGNEPTPALPAFEHAAYVTDVFFGMVWRWRWSNAGDIPSLGCFCRNCDLQLVYQPSHEWEPPKTTFICENCNQSWDMDGPHQYCIERIKREIHLRIRNGSWKQVVERMADRVS